MKKIFLEKLIYKNYLKTSLVSILFIELLLIIIYFTVNHNIVSTSMDFILKDINENTHKIVQTETKSIENKFNEIEKFTKILQNEHQNFFENPQIYKFKNEPVFEYAENKMYYKTNNYGSSVVISNETILTKDVKSKLRDTEVFDTSFKSIVNNEESVVAVYFNSHDNLNRYYPYIPNTYEAFPSNIKMSNYNFYYEADLKHNPKKNVVWTDVYLDPAGQGWMLSSIVPIYNNGFLEGVTGIDVTINTFIRNFLNIKLPYEGKSFIINKDGKIVAMPKEIERILNIKEVSTYTYDKNETIETTIHKASKFDILKYKEKNVSNTFKKILEEKKYPESIKINGKDYQLFSRKIDKTSWFVISLISEDKIFSNVRALENEYKSLGYLIVASIIFFYIIFFIFLYFKAKDLVKNINTPLLKIIEVTRNLGKSKEVSHLDECEIIEIDKLNKNFNQLSTELELRTQKLIKAETQRELNEKLANTDALTGAYNRRFLQDFSNKYIKIAKREDQDLAILLCDIDDFKNINDTYGHHIGDEIIQTFVEIMNDTIRDNDIIIRYGGDEFIVFLPNTSIQSARLVGEKISSMVQEHNQKKDLYFTTSIGVSELEKEDTSIEQLIQRADDALYTAKRLGKNCIV